MVETLISNLLANAPLLVVFVGMAVLQWRVVSALDVLAQLLARQPAPPIPVPVSPVALPAPARQAPIADTSSPVDEALVAAVKKFEGFSPKAYGDYKQYSIGWGTKANSPTEVIDEAEADRRLRAELAACQKTVEAFCPTAPKGVKQALIDLTYNAGPIWEQAELGHLIKAGSYEEAKAHVLQYNHAGGQVNAGLTARRQAEVQWFDHPL